MLTGVPANRVGPAEIFAGSPAAVRHAHGCLSLEIVSLKTGVPPLDVAY